MHGERKLIHHLPLALTALRALLAPVMVAIAMTSRSPAGFALCLIAAFVSDVYDGKIARKLGIATPGLRRLDSIADTIFYVAATWCVWLVMPEIITGHAALLMALLALELARYAFDLWKFGKEASYHMWSSKLWGVFLFAGFLSALVFRSDGAAVMLAIAAGLFADIEGLAISFILPEWKNDVPTVFHALRLRRRMLAARSPSASGG